MQAIRQSSKFTKAFLIVGLTLVVYGYLCRLLSLYFFWESRSIGWVLIYVGLIGLLRGRIKVKAVEGRKTVGEKIGIFICSFLLLLDIGIAATMPFTHAYSAAHSYLMTNAPLKNRIGSVRGFVVMTGGGIHQKWDSGGESGEATIYLTAKGDKKFEDITVYVVKYADSADWKVEGIE